ncbi:MAG TPA: hypothetical protein VK762_03665, partial [Polyangiaceae bacterium]|nr:hypothetical protein [Polyangiaceae bacterium]
MLLFAEVDTAHAASTCLSIGGGASQGSVGTALQFTAQCCSAAPTLPDHGWMLGGLLLVIGLLAMGRASKLASLTVLMAIVSFARPASGQSCGGPFSWQAQSASETFTGTGPSFSFTPTAPGTFVVTLADSVETAPSVTVQVLSLVISQVQTRGLSGASDEFVEIYNPAPGPMTFDATWVVKMMSATSGCGTSYTTLFSGGGQVIPSHAHILYSSATGTSET